MTNWYCSSTAQGNHDGTSWDNAWACASNGTYPIVWGTGGVVAGDTLFIDGGSTSITYTATIGWPDALFEVNGSGTSGNPITIATGAKSPSPTNHDGLVIFDGNMTYDALIWGKNTSYIVYDGEKNGSSNWEFRDIPAGDKTAILIGNGSSHTGNRLKYLTIHNSPIGIKAGTSAADFEVSYCTFYDIYQEVAIRVTGSLNNTLGDIRIHHNNIQILKDPNNSWYGPDGVQATYSLDLYNNIFTSAIGTTVGSQHGDFYAGDYSHTRIYNNRFEASVNAVVYPGFAPGNGPTTIQDFYFFNNLILYSGNFGCTLSGGDSNTTLTQRYYIINNTFVDIHQQGAFDMHFDSGTTLDDIRIENNIFFNSGTGGKFAYIEATTDQCASIVYDYNVVRAGSSGYTGFTCNDVTKSMEHGQTSVDPSFVSYTADTFTSNLHLQAGDTSSRGHGVNLTGLISPDLLSADKDGRSRPSAGAWDIGAYQFDDTGSKIIIHNHATVA